MNRWLLALALWFAATAGAVAAEVNIPVFAITETGTTMPIGMVKALDTDEGLQLTPSLTGLPPGEHGFHVHANGDCGAKPVDGKPVAGMAAGGHLDPSGAGKHEGPAGHGHLGDLPPLLVGADGKASTAVLAPRLKVADLHGHALMIHAGGDNFADEPKPLGGGGARIACGVVL